MKKTLRIKIEKSDLQGIYVRITNQSHFKKEFGSNEQNSDGSYFYASNSIQLASGYQPAYYGENTKILYVMGAKSQTTETIFIPNSMISAIFSAIEEYNRFEFMEKDNQRFKIGDLFTIKEDNLDDALFMLSSVDTKLINLICIPTGNRWSDPKLYNGSTTNIPLSLIKEIIGPRTNDKGCWTCSSGVNKGFKF